MEQAVAPRRKCEIISLADKHAEQVKQKKEGIKIKNGEYLCTCCICGTQFIKTRRNNYYCNSKYCQSVRHSVVYKKCYNNEEIRQRTLQRIREYNRSEKRKAYEHSEAYRKAKNIRAKRYREENPIVKQQEGVHRITNYYRHRSNEKIEGADRFTLEDYKKLYSASTCYYCGKPLGEKEKTVDHKIPISRGGTNSLDNLVISCNFCNIQKKDKTEEEYYEWKREKGK